MDIFDRLPKIKSKINRNNHGFVLLLSIRCLDEEEVAVVLMDTQLVCDRSCQQ